MQIRRSILVTSLAHLATVGSNLLTVPLFLAAFGTDLYGFWGSLLGLTSYLQLLNLGVAQTVSSRLATANHESDREGMAVVVAQGFRMYARICALALPPIVLAAYFSPWPRLFKLPPGVEAQATLAATAVAASFLIELPFSVMRAALVGLGKVHVERTIGTGMLIARLGVAALFAQAQPQLWIAVLLLSVLTISSSVACLLALARALPGLISALFRALPPADASFRTQSAHYLLLQVAGALMWSSDSAIAAAFLGTEGAAQINIAWRVIAVSLTIGTLVSPVVAPAISRAWANRDDDRVHALAREASTLVGGVTVLLALGLATTGRTLFGMWVGEELFIGDAAWLLYSVLVVVQGYLIIPDGFVMQSGTHASYARLTLLESVLKVAASFVLLPRLGLAALPLATLGARLLTVGWYLPLRFWTLVRLPALGSFWRCSVAPMIIPAAAFLAVWAALNPLLEGAAAFWRLAPAVAGALAYSVVFLAFSLPPSIRPYLPWARVSP